MVATLLRLALALVILLLAAACSGDGGGGSPTPPPTPADATAFTEAAAKKVEALKSFHFVLEHENGSSPIPFDLLMTRAEGDMAPPDRLKADVEAIATKLGRVNVKLQVVAVGTNAQITNPFNRTEWVPLPSQQSISDLFDPARGTVAAMRTVKNPRIVGAEKVGTIDTWRVEGELDGGDLEAFAPFAEAGYAVKGIAWVGQADGLVHRIRLEGALGPKDSAGTVRKIELSRFDASVTIEPP